jgi:hypothetical protein
MYQIYHTWNYPFQEFLLFIVIGNEVIFVKGW